MKRLWRTVAPGAFQEAEGAEMRVTRDEGANHEHIRETHHEGKRTGKSDEL